MPDLFGDDDFDPMAEWVGMPEFVQEPDRPHQTIVVRFRCAADVQAFAERLGVRLTPKTKSLWFPPLPKPDPNTRLAYVAEP